MSHFITAKIAKMFQLSGMPDDEREVANIEIEIEYSFRHHRPGNPADVELINANLINGDGLAPYQSQVQEWAEDWLQDAGYEMACTHAEESIRNEP